MGFVTSIATCALVAGTCINAFASNDGNTLLSKATRIGTMDGAPEPNYWWLTDTKALYFEHIPHPLSASERKDRGNVPDDYAPGYYKAFTLDTTDNRRAPFDAFNAGVEETIAAQPMLMSYGGGPATETVYNMPPCALSPDRTWFAWKSPSGWYAASLDGARRVTWPSLTMDGSVCWLSGHRWAQIDSDYRTGQWTFTNVTIHDLTAKTNQTIALNQPADGLIVGASPHGSLLSINFVTGMQTQTSAIPVNTYDISGNHAKASHTHITLPGSYRVWSVVLSTHGDRLAWVLAKRTEYHIYLSDTTGKHWIHMGQISAATTSNGGRMEMTWPQGIRWLPGDKALSFVFGDNLYRMATPSGG